MPRRTKKSAVIVQFKTSCLPYTPRILFTRPLSKPFKNSSFEPWIRSLKTIDNMLGSMKLLSMKRKDTQLLPQTENHPRTSPQAESSTSLKAQTTMSLSIHNVLILDSAADIHVCNSSMAHLYTRQRIAHPDNRVESGAVKLPVESYGCLQVSLDTPIGPGLITLSNVAYVPTVHTNVVALDLFTAKEVYFDSSVPHAQSRQHAFQNLPSRRTLHIYEYIQPCCCCPNI